MLPAAEGAPRGTTRERILETSRRLFNSKGYANTTVADIASEVGIAEGNLWYHFRTKLALVAALEEQLRQAARAIRDAFPTRGGVVDDYVEAVLCGMSQKAAYRFLFRDQLQFGPERRPLRLDPDMAADFDKLRRALDAMSAAGLLRRDRAVDLDMLARSQWMIARYWTDYLEEQEGLDAVEWEDLLRGFEQFFAVLLPHVTAGARRDIEAALERVSKDLMDRPVVLAAR